MTNKQFEFYKKLSRNNERERDNELTETRHCEKEKLIALLMAQSNPETIAMQIAQTKAKMEKEDIEDVMKEFENWKNGN